jgi:hypothetical protein
VLGCIKINRAVEVTYYDLPEIVPTPGLGTESLSFSLSVSLSLSVSPFETDAFPLYNLGPRSASQNSFQDGAKQDIYCWTSSLPFLPFACSFFHLS